MRKRSGIVIEGVSEEAKLVDAAQIEVLRYAKYAAEQMLTDTAYLKGVERIVELLIGILTNDELKARCRALFPSYAVKMLLRERALVRTYALWYGYALAARSLNKRGGRAAFERANKAISPTLRKTPLFKAVITSIPDKAYNWAVPLEQWERNYTKTINRILVDLVYSDAKEDYTTNVNLRNIAEMTVRYERQLERLEELKAD
jgi:hypothetical protein